MRIVLAASIYPPEIGGPAYYASQLKEAFEREGHTVDVIVFSAFSFFPSGLRHLAYTLFLVMKALKSDGIIAFDVLTTGFPAVLAGMITRTPVVARVGGDFIWESYVERTNDLLPLPMFYEHKERWSMKERMVFSIARWVLRRAHVAFSSPWLRDLWALPYDLGSARTAVIENALPKKQQMIEPVRKNFLMYGRQIALKNHDAFCRAFAEAKQTHPEIELEEGTMPHNELIERIRGCYAVVLPSISDVTPNYILDTLSCGKPFLLTKYSGYAGRFKDLGVMIDPLDVEDMIRGIKALADKGMYEKLQKRIEALNETHTYADIAREFVALLKHV